MMWLAATDRCRGLRLLSLLDTSTLRFAWSLCRNPLSRRRKSGTFYPGRPCLTAQSRRFFVRKAMVYVVRRADPANSRELPGAPCQCILKCSPITSPPYWCLFTLLAYKYSRDATTYPTKTDGGLTATAVP